MVPGFLAQLRETLHVWRERMRQRRELAQWTDRDLHDVGLSWSDIATRPKSRFGGREAAARPAPPPERGAGQSFGTDGSLP